MKGSAWFALGLSLLAAILGFLVGASHSPVAGVAITAAFGLAVPLFSLLGGKGPASASGEVKNHRALSPRELEGIGKVLFAFCVVFMAGIALGGYARLRDWPAPHHSATFPWKDQAPSSAYHAIDWIIVQHRLREMGYSDQQVQEVYSIQRKEWGSTEPSSSGAALSSLFSQGAAVKKDFGGLVVYQDPGLLPDWAKPGSLN